MRHIQLCTGLLVRDGSLLLVRGRYAEEAKPLWTLPGGRQEAGETIAQAVVREFKEETSLGVTVGELAYIAESFDDRHGWHVINVAFFVSEREPAVTPGPADPKIVEARFVPADSAAAVLAADVLRIPVARALSGAARPGYFAFRSADIVVPFFGRNSDDG